MSDLPNTLHKYTWHFLKPFKIVAIIFIGVALLAGCWGPFNSILIKQIINVLSSAEVKDISSLGWLCLLLVLNFVVFDNITWRLIGYFSYKYQPIIKNKIIRETFEVVLGSSHQFFQDNLSGYIAKQISTLADNIERIIDPISVNFVRGSSLLIIALISCYYVDPKFFYVMALWFLAFSFVSIYLSKRLIDLSDIHASTESVISGQLVDSIANSSNIRIFAKKSYEVARLDGFLLASKEAFRKKESFFIILNIVQGALISIMLGFMAYLLISLYRKGLVTAGDFALILGLSMEVGHMMWFTMSQVDEFNQAVGKCKQALSSLIVPQVVKDKVNAHELVVAKGEIRFNKVKFHYKGSFPLFQDKSLIIKGGQKVGLVGYSGGGKTTFVNLILRLYDVTDGSIFIDDQDIRDCTQDSLRANIAMIPQDPSLFHRSLRENIRYGKIDATDEEVIIASQKAHAHEFIVKLAEGYDSLVGERGVKLSGGQRQRIAIARAILKNAPILILDEATSQLDSVTERLIQDALTELMQGKTTIIIAHRLSTLLNMDRILVFDKGEVVEDGTHAELLAKDGMYAKLWNSQVGGFLGDGKIKEDEE
jgi:ATP-binding cassette subfamily B protein